MKFGTLLIALILAVPSLPQEKNQPFVYVKHLEPPLRYPPVAQAARLHGTVVAKLLIGTNGAVLAVEAMPGDGETVGYPLLRAETEKVVKKWTFGCVNCSTHAPYEKSIKFVYQLEGEDSSRDETRVVMELPDQVAISARPPECDHCPTKK